MLNQRAERYLCWYNPMVWRCNYWALLGFLALCEDCDSERLLEVSMLELAREKRVIYVFIPPPLDAITYNMSAPTRLPWRRVRFGIRDKPLSILRWNSTRYFTFSAQPGHVGQNYGEYSDDHCCTSEDVGHTPRSFPSAWHCAQFSHRYSLRHWEECRK